MTTEYENLKNYCLREEAEQKAMELIACGIDPERSVLFIQSDVPAHVELAMLFSMFTPLPWLERVPTYKEQIQNLTGKDLLTHGFLGYPVLQAADILLYLAEVVPVGEDQLPHIELTREIARRFNFFYGDLFPEPQSLQTPTTRLPGLDNRKMSKSYNNAINLIDSDKETTQKVSQMITDPQRVRKSDPGNPDVCAVFTYHTVYTPLQRCTEIKQACRKAEIGCVQCKKELAANINAQMTPIRERYTALAQNPDEVRDLLKTGAQKASEIAEPVLESAKKLTGLSLRNRS